MNYFQFRKLTPESGEEGEFDSLESFLTRSSCIMCKASTAFLDARLISFFPALLFKISAQDFGGFRKQILI